MSTCRHAVQLIRTYLAHHELESVVIIIVIVIVIITFIVSAIDLQDEQAAVMDRLIWQPQPVDLLSSVQIKQVCLMLHSRSMPLHEHVLLHGCILSLFGADLGMTQLVTVQIQ